jgi:outer membrane protein assembly factor BamB
MNRTWIGLGLGTVVVASALMTGGLAIAQSSAETIPDDWPMFKGDAARRSVAADGPDGDPVVRWRYQAEGGVTGNVSVAGDLAFASSDDGVLHALDLATGVERWRHVPERPPVSAPTVADGVVYLLVGFDTLVALDASTGAVSWTSDVALRRPSEPAVGDGAVFVGTDDGQLVAVEMRDGSERWRAQLTTGAVHRPSFAAGAVFVGTDAAGMFRVEAADGTTSWQLDTGVFPTASVVVADGVAYIGAANYDVAGDGRLWAVDALTGELRWRLDEPILVPAIRDGIGYAGSLGLGVSAYDLSDGSRLWTFPAEGFIRPLAVAEDLVYVPVDDEQRVYALETRTGTERWHIDLDAATDCCVAVAQGAAFVGTWNGSVYSIGGSADTSPAPSIATPVASRSAELPDPFTVVGGLDPELTGLEGAWSIDVGSDGNLYVVDAKPSITVLTPDGQPLRSWGSPGSGEGELNFGPLAPTIAVSDQGLIHVTEGGNHRVSVFQADGTFVRHIGSFGDGPGQFLAPLEVFLDGAGHVYVVDDVRQTVSRFDPTGALLWELGGEDETDPDLVGYHHGGSVDSDGRIWLTIDGPPRVIAVDAASGRKLELFGARGDGPGEFSIGPCAVDLDDLDRAYVIDCSDRRLNVFDADNQPIARWEAPAGLPFGLSYAFGPDGVIYAVAGGNRADGGTVESPDTIVVIEVDLPTDR